MTRGKWSHARPSIRALPVPLAVSVAFGAAWCAADGGLTVARGPAPAAVVVGLALTALLGRFALRGHLARRRRREQWAAELLEYLRAEAVQPGTLLLEVHAVQWVALTGQRVWAVDALTGEVSDRWVPRLACPPGSLVLLRQAAAGPSEVHACMTPSALKAAIRQRDSEIDKRTSPGHLVVAAAEALLRRGQ